MDKKQLWKYGKISLILGCIAAGSGLLIGGTNMLTADRIAENDVVAKMNGIKEVYGENTIYGDEVIIDDSNYSYLESFYTAKTSQGNLIGHVFVASGRNAYGSIKVGVGIDEDGTISRISTMKLDQSFAGVIEEEYLDKFNSGVIGIDDVKCGATVGASLISSMAKQASRYYSTVIKSNDIRDQYANKVYGSDATYSEFVAIESTDANNKLVEYLTASKNNAVVGYVFHAYMEEDTQYGKKIMEPVFGINADGSLGHIELAIAEGHHSIQTNYVDEINAGTREYTDVACGATQSANKLKAIIDSAIAYYTANLKEGK